MNASAAAPTDVQLKGIVATCGWEGKISKEGECEMTLCSLQALEGIRHHVPWHAACAWSVRALALAAPNRATQWPGARFRALCFLASPLRRTRTACCCPCHHTMGASTSMLSCTPHSRTLLCATHAGNGPRASVDAKRQLGRGTCATLYWTPDLAANPHCSPAHRGSCAPNGCGSGTGWARRARTWRCPWPSCPARPSQWCGGWAWLRARNGGEGGGGGTQQRQGQRQGKVRGAQV